MYIARKIVEYVNKLTQQTSKLLSFQKESNLAIYSGHGFCAKKLLQDVIARWWLTYCMLKRLRFLKPALMCVYAAKVITRTCWIMTNGLCLSKLR
jgi:hypothetical protein